MFMCLSQTAGAAGAESAPGLQQNFIHFDRVTQHVSASVDAKPFDWVLQQLHQAAGIEFTVFEDDYAPVSAQFDNLPLAKAIERLLHDASHMISTGDTIRVFVLSREDGKVTSTDNESVTAAPIATPGNNNQQHKPMTTPDGVTASAKTPVNLKRQLIDSLGDAPEFDDLRAQLEQMPDQEVSEEDNRLLQATSDGQIADILLNNLIQAGANRRPAPNR